MTPANLLTAWARLLIESFVAAGVTDAVVSPGSRSTPFTSAALDALGLRTHVIVDERSAAFFALGQARVSGRPALLICTSGSAAANYLPALVEATLGRVPLIALTADRPFELSACGAAQTIDQIKLFGDHAKRYVELGMPDAAPAALAALQRKAAQAVADSCTVPAGPVHLDARARKPLEPREATDDAGRALDAEVDRLLKRGPVRASPSLALADPDSISRVADECARSPCGVIVCGPTAIGRAPPPPSLAALADATGYPVLCEATSQLRFAMRHASLCDGFEALLASRRFRAGPAPGIIIQIGAAPTSRAWDAYLRAFPGARRHVLADAGWPDPWNDASSIVTGDLGRSVRDLGDAVAARNPSRDADWLARFRRGNALSWSAVEEVLARGSLGEGGAVRLALDALPAGGLLALGNSLPVRLVDAFCPACDRGIHVLAQRGACGIDGVTSGAAGAAAISQRPTTLVVGDVGFLHDVGGLWAARDVATPLVILVVDNNGGRIFEQLPIADEATRDLSAWLTPHGFDLSHAAALYGLPFVRATAPAALGIALREAHGRSGASVVEAVVPPHGALADLRAIHARVDEGWA